VNTEQIVRELVRSEAALAFALAQGDGYAEDAAAARIATLKAQLAATDPCAQAGRHV
jgi:hypothetical protein